MLVNPISPTSFKASEAEMMFADLSDRDLKEIAYEEAKRVTNDKFHKKVDNAMYYSLPLVGGLSILGTKLPTMVTDIKAASKAGVLADVFETAQKEGCKLIDCNVVRGFKLGAAANSTAKWALALLAVNTIFKARHLLESKSAKMKDFRENHPILSAIMPFTAGMIAISGIGVGMNKLYDKFGANIFEGEKLNKILNNSKILNKASKVINKIPSSAKAIGKTGLALSPIILFAGMFAHEIKHNKNKYNSYLKSYEDLKNAQMAVRENIKEEIEAGDV